MLSIVIQAGGESRRMGRDKALLPFLGRPLIAHMVERLSPLADEVLVTTNRPPDYAFLGLPLFPDLLPGRGALGGLYTALSAAQHPLVAIVACDMPFVNLGLLAACRDALLAGAAAAALPLPAGGVEPFHAVYRRSACLPPILAALAAGKWRVDSWFPEVELHFIPPAEIARHDPHGLAFWNTNTPEELQAAIERAAQLAAGQSGPLS